MPAVSFAILTTVDSSAVPPSAAGMFVGSMLMPRITSHVPERLLQWFAARLVNAPVVWLWVTPSYVSGPQVTRSDPVPVTSTDL